MNYPIVKLVYDRRHQACNTRGGVVEVRVTYRRTQKYYSTGVRVLARQWDGEQVIGHPQSVDLNLRIDTLVRPIRDYIAKLMIAGEPFTFAGLAAALDMSRIDGSFVEFAEQTIEERKDLRPLTKRNHRRIVASLRDYGRIVSFSDLTTARVKDYDKWLHGKGYIQTTVATYHKLLKIYIHEAMARGLVERDPYLGFRVDRGKSRPQRFLTESELAAIIRFEPEDPTLRRARDLFVFQCFTGLSYADLMRFDFANVEERDGRWVLRDARQKSGEDYYIVILPPAMEVLRRYGFKLPKISNQKYNAALKGVGAVVNRSITSHMGRHTYACMLLNQGMPIEIVAKAMGHTNIKQTQEYARIIDKTLERAFDNIRMPY